MILIVVSSYHLFAKGAVVLSIQQWPPPLCPREDVPQIGYLSEER